MELGFDVLPERIEKHELAKFETHAVLGAVTPILANVPLEAHFPPCVTTEV